MNTNLIFWCAVLVASLSLAFGAGDILAAFGWEAS